MSPRSRELPSSVSTTRTRRGFEGTHEAGRQDDRPAGGSHGWSLGVGGHLMAMPIDAFYGMRMPGLSRRRQMSSRRWPSGRSPEPRAPWPDPACRPKIASEHPFGTVSARCLERVFGCRARRGARDARSNPAGARGGRQNWRTASVSASAIGIFPPGLLCPAPAVIPSDYRHARTRRSIDGFQGGIPVHLFGSLLPEPS
jgi:hypothetical protein